VRACVCVRVCVDQERQTVDQTIQHVQRKEPLTITFVAEDNNTQKFWQTSARARKRVIVVL